MHPPLLAEVGRLSLLDENEASRRSVIAKERLGALIKVWLPRFQNSGITLSLETNVTPRVFAFAGIHDFRDFALSLPGLGVLADVSHNVL